MVKNNFLADVRVGTLPCLGYRPTSSYVGIPRVGVKSVPRYEKRAERQSHHGLCSEVPVFEFAGGAGLRGIKSVPGSTWATYVGTGTEWPCLGMKVYSVPYMLIPHRGIILY